MGAGLVILIHLIAIFIVSIIIAVIGVVITFIISKERQVRKAVFAFSAPFVGFYALYICGFFCSSIVAGYKKIDMGIGDCWYVPLENNRQLLLIDLPEQCYIAKEDGMLLISEVSKIQEHGNEIFGETLSGKYFSYNTLTDEVGNFNSQKELMISKSVKKLSMIKAYDFYSAKYNKLAGLWFIVVGIFSILIAIASLCLLKMIIVW
ncbi:hypothetical protein VUJ46_18205 [Chryseobacterium sp. MYb264]|uniref:hypothetical protein n=1 Tax=Chryseobacterium sp. MYb264 TaxID=2745153 RepID=UPI002E110FC0|nr:hypothetical protein VUJ46_18205 [Chryseobacterium sp. MYb264]